MLKSTASSRALKCNNILTFFGIIFQFTIFLSFLSDANHSHLLRIEAACRTVAIKQVLFKNVFKSLLGGLPANETPCALCGSRFSILLPFVVFQSRFGKNHKRIYVLDYKISHLFPENSSLFSGFQATGASPRFGHCATSQKY